MGCLRGPDPSGNTRAGQAVGCPSGRRGRGPKWGDIVIEGGPEDQDGLMKLRHELDTFACIRHARAWDALIDRIPYLPERVHGTDIVVMRELCAGAMFTRTGGMDTTATGERRAYDLNEYADGQIRRFARIGFQIARRRTGRAVSVDKSNVFIAGKLWREAVDEVGRSEFPDAEMTHLFTDNAAYQLACLPTSMWCWRTTCSAICCPTRPGPFRDLSGCCLPPACPAFPAPAVCRARPYTNRFTAALPTSRARASPIRLA